MIHLSKRRYRTAKQLIAVTLLAASVAACGSDAKTDSATSTTEGTGGAKAFSGTLRVSAIPDQDPEKLQRTYGLVAAYLEKQLPGIKVEYVPVTDYQASVSSFRTNDLDLVWFGGLTGVQARTEVSGAVTLAQRDIDAKFTSVFVASPDAGLSKISDVSALKTIAGHSLTFGSESSTSGRVMPQYFLKQAGVDVKTDMKGNVGFSGSHDKTIALVSAGTFEVGALNSSVWDKAVDEGKVDETKVQEIFRTPTFFDYHWLAQPTLDAKFGANFTASLGKAILALDGSDAEELAILELFGAKKFIETKADNYARIEEIGKEIGVIR